MNNVSFGGIYLHSYPSQKDAQRTYRAIQQKMKVLNSLGCDMRQKIAAIPVHGAENAVFVFTEKDAINCAKVVEEKGVRSIIDKAVKIFHKK